MKYGFALSGRGPLAEPDALSAIARKGDELGFEWLLTGDHIVVPDSIDSTYPYTEGGEFPGSASGMAMEQLTVLSFLAGQTRRIRLVTSVMIVPHRNPLVAAKALATLDVLSKGRLVVGIGAGWMREEFEALGLPPFEERGAVTDEYIRAFQELWSSDNPTFDGKYLSFSDITFLPKPVQKPHLPIWVGGESRAAIRRAGQVGDAWYPIGSNPQFPMGDPEALAAGMRRLAAQTERAGRDPSEVETVFRTHDYRLEAAGISRDRPYFAGSVEQIAADIHTYEELGVSGLVFDLGRISRDVDDVLRHLEDLATRVMPAV